jgi:hypothetical protein
VFEKSGATIAMNVNHPCKDAENWDERIEQMLLVQSAVSAPF